MAIGATIFKAQLQISDMDRHYYETHDLTLAQHPSETDLRLMVRLVAFALNAHERLVFSKGIGGDDEAELWQKEYSGDVALWVEFGQVDEKRLRKASGKAERVIVYGYQEGAVRPWWKQNESKYGRFDNVEVVLLCGSESLESLCARSMRLQCNVMEGELTMHSELGDVSVHQEWLKRAK